VCRLPAKGRTNMGKRFAILIGAAALGMMALSAQTTAAPYDLYDATVTIKKERGEGRKKARVHGVVKADVILRHGEVTSVPGKCETRRVILKRDWPRHQADQTVGLDRSRIGPNGEGVWTMPKSSLKLRHGWHRLHAKVKIKGHPRDGFVCRGNSSEAIRVFVR
jgi:hypothetical protein